VGDFQERLSWAHGPPECRKFWFIWFVHALNLPLATFMADTGEAGGKWVVNGIYFAPVESELNE